MALALILYSRGSICTDVDGLVCCAGLDDRGVQRVQVRRQIRGGFESADRVVPKRRPQALRTRRRRIRKHAQSFHFIDQLDGKYQGKLC